MLFNAPKMRICNWKEFSAAEVKCNYMNPLLITTREMLLTIFRKFEKHFPLWDCVTIFMLQRHFFLFRFSFVLLVNTIHNTNNKTKNEIATPRKRIKLIKPVKIRHIPHN